MHDIVQALNLLEEVMTGNEDRVTSFGLYYDHGKRCLVGECLSRLGVSDEVLILLGPRSIDFLYERDLSPLPMTLGGMLVYRSAQRTQDGLCGEDHTWGGAFQSAVRTASRVIDLIPDRAIPVDAVRTITESILV